MRTLAFLLAVGALPFDREAARITSPMAAAYTPFKDQYELKLDIIPEYAKWLKARNITNVMPAGTNGESLSLSVEERKALAEAWVKAAAKEGLKVYVHIGAESLVDVLALAKHAAETPGIAGILAMAPVYFKPTVQSMHDMLALISQAAPKLPLWFYHFPDMTGVLTGKAVTLLELAEQTGKIPTLMGIKYTDENLMDFQACLAFKNGKYNMLFGRDEEAIAGMLVGAAAPASSTIQFSPTLRMAIHAFQEGRIEEAVKFQHENAALCHMFGPYAPEGKNVQKSIIRMAGLDVGPSRLPQLDLSDEEYTQLEKALKMRGFLDLPKTAVVV